jgi:hypothetical protein
MGKIGGRRERDGDERSRAVLEEQQFDGKEHRGDRAAERRRHACGRTCGQQHFALVGRGAQHLADHRPERASGRDDRPLGTERPTGPDRDGGRQGFEKRDTGRDTALVEEDLFHRLGDAVPPDGGRPVPRHESHDHRAGDGNQDHHRTEMVVRRGREGRRPGAVEGEVGDEPDQRGEQPRRERCEDRDPDRQSGEQQDPAVSLGGGRQPEFGERRRHWDPGLGGFGAHVRARRRGISIGTNLILPIGPDAAAAAQIRWVAQ